MTEKIEQGEPMIPASRAILVDEIMVILQARAEDGQIHIADEGVHVFIEDALKRILKHRTAASDDDPLDADERRMLFTGATIDTQRLRIETAHLSDLCGDFVCVYHLGGDDSVSNLLFTNAEARYLSATLLKIIHAWSTHD